MASQRADRCGCWSSHGESLGEGAWNTGVCSPEGAAQRTRRTRKTANTASCPAHHHQLPQSCISSVFFRRVTLKLDLATPHTTCPGSFYPTASSTASLTGERSTNRWLLGLAQNEHLSGISSCTRPSSWLLSCLPL